jgi:hypothetical protein
MNRSTPRSLTFGLMALAITATVAPLAAQETTLGTPLATYDEGLSYVQAIREMPDGRVMIADPLAGELFFLDMKTGRKQPFGREGGGPMEYRQPDSVWPWGDGALLVDLGNARLTEVDAEGTFGETHPLVVGEMGMGTGMILAIPSGVDGNGGVYATQRPSMRGRGSGTFSDSSLVVRVDLATETVDTIASIKTQDLEVQSSGGNTSVQQVPLSKADAFGVAPDGRVVIARSGDYHVEWIGMDGSVVRGPALDYRPVRIGNAEKREYFARQTSAGIAVEVMAGPGGQRSMSLSRGGGGGRDPDEPDLNANPWPDEMPAMANARINVDSEGRAWVLRNMPAGQPRNYDVFDGQANRVGTVVLPEGRQIIGFGDGVLYATWLDEFDLVYLEKYAMPRL